MRKVLLIIGCLVGIQSICQAQTFDEWFRQKKTQRKYLLQQIAAFRLYAGYLSKGYDIARNGTGLVRSITNGEFSLHDGFLTSLRYVNPKIRSYGRIADFIALQAALVKTQKEGMRQARSSGQFSTRELALFGEAFASMLENAVSSLDELARVLTDNALELGDDQRILRIDKLYAEAVTRGAAARALYRDISLSVADRQRQAAALDGMRTLYNVEKK